MTKKKTSRILWIISLGCMVVLGVIILSSVFSQPEMLTESQVAALRDQYPITASAKLEPDPLASVEDYQLTLEEVKQYHDSIVYCEVVGKAQRHTLSLSIGFVDFDQKRADMGFDNTINVIEYEVSVIEDTEGIFQEGDTIIMRYNTRDSDLIPTLGLGQQFILPVDETTGDPPRYLSYSGGTFYVTEDGYALSAFEEEKAGLARSARLSGRKVEDVMDFLRDL